MWDEITTHSAEVAAFLAMLLVLVAVLSEGTALLYVPPA
jgi:hypothetical protein